MTDTTKTEALRLADLLRERFGATVPTSQAAAELRRLSAVEAERDRCRKTLEQAGFTDLGGEYWKPPIPAEATALAGILRETQAERDRLAAECEALRGLVPDLPPRPPHYNDSSYQHPALPRYGLRWNGPSQPVSVPMADGYWTPFHLAYAAMGGKE